MAATLTPYLRTVRDAITSSGLTATLTKEAREAASTKRREAFEALQSCGKEWNARLRKLASEEEKARKAAAEAAAAHVQAQRELFRATQARNAAAHQFDCARKELEARVRAMAPPELHNFATLLQAVRDALVLIKAPSWEGGAAEGVFELTRAGFARLDVLRVSAATDQEIVDELRETRDRILKSYRKFGPMPHQLEVAAQFEEGPPEAA
jgi:hypothetical protein